MAMYASEMVKKAQSFIGLKESDKSHKKIIDIYNKHKPLPRGYKVKLTDNWCAVTWSALAIELGYTSIIPIECSCGEIIKLAKEMCIWVEDDDYTPKPGDGIVYDWDDNGKGDNTGWPDHIGIIEKCGNKQMTVIEGNYGNAVKRRIIKVGAKGIRGFIVPKYDAEPKKVTTTTTKKVSDTKMPTIKEGSTGKAVKIWQVIIGAEPDGKFGPDTKKKTKAFQKKHKLDQDCVVGPKTWKAGLESV